MARPAKARKPPEPAAKEPEPAAPEKFDDERKSLLGFLDSLYASVVVMAITIIADRNKGAAAGQAAGQLLETLAPMISIGVYLLDDWVSARPLLQKYGYSPKWKGSLQIFFGFDYSCYWLYYDHVPNVCLRVCSPALRNMLMRIIVGLSIQLVCPAGRRANSPDH